MTNQFTNSAVAYLRNKLAAAADMPPEAAHEAIEAPEQEALEHAEGAGEGQEQHEEGGLEQLLSQLSPEEMEQLAAELSGDIQDPNAVQGGEDVASLAHAISAHLGQSPEANVPVGDPEKQAAFEFVKSASYIHGFLNQAVHDGIGIKTAVDLYDSSLALTIENLKSAELKGGQHKLDVNKNGKIDASDLKHLRAGKHEKSESSKEEKMVHKTAAYYEGVFERAAEYGIPAAVVKKASAESAVDGTAKTLKDYISQAQGMAHQGIDKAKGFGDTLAGYGNDAAKYLGEHPGQAVGGGAALGAAGLMALQHHLSKKKEEEMMRQYMQ